MKKPILASMVVGLLVICSLGADETLPPEQIRAGEARQTQIKMQTQQVAAQLASIIDEFKRNGLDGQDVEVLEAIRRVLGKLSDQEMKKVIDALQEARSESNPSASKKAFAGAVSDQKAIIAQLRALLLEYQRQQALYELSLRLAALAERQNGNLKTVVDLAKMTGNQTASRFDDTQRASLQIQAADQQGLKDEVNPLLTKLESLTKDADGPTKDRLNKAMEQAKSGGLKPAMDAAIEDLKGAALYRAAGSEKIVRDQLRELARLVAPPKDTLASLQAALKEIEKQIEAEKTIIDQTKKMDKRTEMAELENRQADVVDKTDAVRNDLQAIAPDASNELKNAQDQMQEARANMSEQKRADALKSEMGALEKLEAAKKALQEQIAKTEPQPKPEDRLAAAKQLQERTRDMIKKEEEIKTATAANERKEKELRALAPKQADVEEQTRDLQRDAAAQAQEAAQSIGEAAQQMDKSEKNLAKPQQPKTAQEAQAAAISSLKQAEEQLGKQVEQLEKAKQELADLMDSRAKVIKLIDQQQKVELVTAKLAAKSDAKSPAPQSPAPAKDNAGKVEVNYMAAEEAGTKAPAAAPTASVPKDLAPPQGELAKQTEQVKTELLESEKTASQPLEDAKKNMLDAKGKLDANDAKRATPAQLEALVNLYKAKDALDKKIQDLQKQLGQEPQNADPNAAAEKIAQLQQDVAKANDQLNADPQQMQKSLQQQQKEIAQALEQMQKGQQANSPQKPPLDQAQQAANQAAQQLAQANNEGALKSMEKAQQGIQEAMKAQPQQGRPEQGQPQQGQPQQGQPQQGQSQQEQPQQGQPQQGQPQQSQPQQGQPGQGQPGQGQPGQGQPGQGLPQLAQKQADLQNQLKQMMAGDPTQQAAAGLEQAAGEAGQLAAGQQGALPPGAAQAVQQAAAALAQAAAAAAGGDTPGAQASASDAQAALAQAAAALSLAQAGLNGQMASAQGQGQQGQGQGQGQGQQGQGKGQQPGQGQARGQGEGKGPNTPNRGAGNRNSIQGGSFSAAIPGKDEKNAGQYQALPQRDRNAITQSRNEKYPEEYGPQVEQYLKNLADQEESNK